MAEVLDQYQDSEADILDLGNYDRIKLAQSFKPSLTSRLSKVTLKMCRVNNPVDSVLVSIYTNDGGVPGERLALCDNPKVAADVMEQSEGTEEVDFLFSNGPILTANTTYFIVAERTGDQQISDGVQLSWFMQDTTDPYPNGEGYYYNEDSGPAWISFASLYPTDYADLYFKEYYETATNLSVPDQKQINFTNNAQDFGTSTGVQKFSQEFNPETSGELTCVKLWLGKLLTGQSDNVQVSIYSDNSGPDTLIETSADTVSGEDIPTLIDEDINDINRAKGFNFNFTNVNVTADTVYHIVVSRTGTLDDSYYYYITEKYDSFTGPYSRRQVWVYIDGAGWSNNSSYAAKFVQYREQPEVKTGPFPTFIP
jgi:hypothetical protein